MTHQKMTRSQQKAAEDTTQLSQRYCSWCLSKADHELYKKHSLRRSVYQCQSCLNYTLPCSFCLNMAKGAKKDDVDDFLGWDNFRCAEHDGSVKNFDNTDIILKDISDFAQLLANSKDNYSISDKLGQHLFKAYFKNDEKFNIVKLNVPPKSSLSSIEKVVFINGFLSEKDQFQEWLTAHQEVTDHYEAYGLTWTSHSLNDVIQHFTPTKIFSLRSKTLLAAQLIHTLATNPWHAAMKRTQDVGELLGNVLRHTDSDTYHLIAHSLGCRIIYYALRFLQFYPQKKVHNVILLGGAVGNQTSDWESITDTITGKIYNCYSQNDEVLRKAYKLSTFYTSDPVGSHPITTSDPKIINIDCSDIIKSHHDWKTHYSEIYRRIKLLANTPGD